MVIRICLAFLIAALASLGTTIPRSFAADPPGLEYNSENPFPIDVEPGQLGDEYVSRMGGVELDSTEPATETDAASADTLSSSHGRIAIMLNGGGDILVVNGDGSGLRRLTRGFDPMWSPDGSQLAVTRYDTPHGIYVVNGDTGADRRVYDVEYARSPSWSPDGTKLAFQTPFETIRWLLNPDGSIMIRNGVPVGVPDQRYRIEGLSLTDGKSFGLESDLRSWTPSWSSDGKSVIFKGDKGLYLTDPENGMRHIPGTDSRFLSPVFSPDGRTIAAVWRQHDHYEIVTINCDGSGFQNLTSTQIFGQQASNNLSPAWSPDGTQIAFVTDKEGTWKVYVMNADGSDQRKLVETPPINYEQSVERIISWGR